MNCSGIFGRLFGHKYQPRYSQATAYPENLEEILSQTSDPWKEDVLVEAVGRSSKYHGEVCVRCGHTLTDFPA